MANVDEIFKEIDKGRYGIITWEGIVEIIQRALYNQDNIESKVQRLLELVNENELNKIWFNIPFDKECVEIKKLKKNNNYWYFFN